MSCTGNDEDAISDLIDGGLYQKELRDSEIEELKEKIKKLTSENKILWDALDTTQRRDVELGVNLS